MFEGLKVAINSIGGRVFGQKGEPGQPEIQKPIDERALIDLVDREFKRRQEERRPHELQWRLNQAFFEGNQYVDINTGSMNLEEMPLLYEWQEREAFNHIAPNIYVRISKLKRVQPLLKVKPGTSEQADLHAAKVGTMLLKNNFAEQAWRDKFSEELAWMEVCGTVFEKRVWNPNKGPVIGIMQDPETGETVEIREGDSETIVVPPQEFYPDSSWRSDIDACRSIIHAKAMHIDTIFETWGIRVAAEKSESERYQKTMTGLGGLGYGQGGFRLQNVKLEDHAIVKEYWELPTRQHPEGRLIIVANGKLLHHGPMPFMTGEDGTPGYPFVRLVCLQRPGCFWGKAVIDHLIPIQRRYNALRNRKAEYLNRTAIGQWLVEEDSIDIVSLENEAASPGAIHVYRKGFTAPMQVQNPPLPNAFETEEHTLLTEFSILSGVSEVSRDSSVPSGVNSGVAIGLLQEQDDTRISNTAENIERFLIKAGKVQLRLFKQFVQAPRTLNAVGRNNVVEVIDWVGSDLSSDDIILDTTSALAESPSSKRQMVFDLLKTGLLNDPETGQITREIRSKVFEMIEMGEWESADDEDQLHMSRAERENMAMEQGQMPPVVSYDDHVIHIKRHNNYRLTTDFEQLRAQNPALEYGFDMHVNMHLMYIQQAAMAQMQQQLATAGQQDNNSGGESVA